MRTLGARAVVWADARGGDGDGGGSVRRARVLIALGWTCMIPNPDHRSLRGHQAWNGESVTQTDTPVLLLIYGLI